MILVTFCSVLFPSPRASKLNVSIAEMASISNKSIFTKLFVYSLHDAQKGRIDFVIIIRLLFFSPTNPIPQFDALDGMRSHL